MSKAVVVSNPLGDVRAEADHVMLSQAFFETPDYLTLLESQDKIIVVGRRGTGKSALTYKLEKQWSSVKTNTVILINPDEHHMLSLRHWILKLGTEFLVIKASSRLIWRYGLLLAAAQALTTKFKIKEAIASCPTLMTHLHRWGKSDTAFFDKLRALMKLHLSNELEPTEVIGHLADALQIAQIEKELQRAIPLDYQIKILLDRLDEGFEPDLYGVAFIDGMVTAAIDIATSFKGRIRPIAFLRDNIFRAVAHYDQDYSRNIEAFTLRLHWDINTLFYFVSNRFRTAFKDQQENNKRLWNRYTEYDLQGEDGFKKCLSLTLYRPRDILILLNSAFEAAKRRIPDQLPTTIAVSDLEFSAKTISSNRLDDLRKEYRHIFNSIDASTAIFANGSPELSIDETSQLLDQVIIGPSSSIAMQQEIAILQQPIELIKSLYSVGFFGVHDTVSGTFLFCHDGKKPDVNFRVEDKILIHPCYWMALSLSRSTLNPDEAAEINDEYEIKVKSITPQIRLARLGKIMTDLVSIPNGVDGATEFEHWVLEACRICFAGRLDNIDLHPNKNSTNRRDIVGTNLGNSIFWNRVQQDYGTRQVIFEVKNYVHLTQDDYRQVLAYLSGQYGNLAFLISKDHTTDLERDKELAWFKGIYNDHKKMIIKLTGKHLSQLLSKNRNPQKHDAADQSLSKLLDTYERLYLGQSSGRSKKKK